MSARIKQRNAANRRDAALILDNSKRIELVLDGGAVQDVRKLNQQNIVAATRMKARNAAQETKE